MSSEGIIPGQQSVFDSTAASDADAQSNTLAPPGAEWPDQTTAPSVAMPVEIGGRQGPDPTRYGDWELKGRCIDF